MYYWTWLLHCLTHDISVIHMTLLYLYSALHCTKPNLDVRNVDVFLPISLSTISAYISVSLHLCLQLKHYQKLVFRRRASQALLAGEPLQDLEATLAE